MKQPRSRREKVDLLKGMLAGKVTIKHHLAPKVFTVYSVAPDTHLLFDKDGYLITPEQKVTDKTDVWVNIVCTESDTRFILPHNNREKIHFSQIKTTI